MTGKKKKEKKNTSLRLDREMLKELKRRALDTDSSVQKIIEELIKIYLNGNK